MAVRDDSSRHGRGPSARGGDVELGLATLLMALLIIVTVIVVPALAH